MDSNVSVIKRLWCISVFLVAHQILGCLTILSYFDKALSRVINSMSDTIQGLQV